MASFGLATLAEGGASLVVDGKHVISLADAGETRNVAGLLADWEASLPRLAAIAADANLVAKSQPFESASFAAPWLPGTIYCTGANYRKHVIGLIMGDHSARDAAMMDMNDKERLAAAERLMDERAKGDAYCFIKLSSCVTGPTDDIILPADVTKNDWELELGVVIGRRADRVSPEHAMEHVAGYVIANDLTARDHVFRRDIKELGGDWLSAKNRPTFLPLGPMIVPKYQVPNPRALTIRLSVNGRVFQNESTSDMLIGIEQQISYISHRMPLMPGDLICTGSPFGNGAAFGIFLRPGDVMEGTITGLGTQCNRCVAQIPADHL